MKITEALTVEHITLRAVFDEIERMLPSMIRVEDVKALGGLIESLLQRHADVEENLLCSTLDASSKEVGRLVNMSKEHGELDQRLAQLDGLEDLHEARRLLRNVIQYSRQHFRHEETEVFPVIAHRLPEESLKAIGLAWHAKQVFSSAT